MNVLAKPQLENTILLDELIDIMENLGIPDEGGNAGEMNQQEEEAQETPEPNQKKEPAQANNKKGMNIDDLSDEAKNLLFNFLLYLEQESMTVSNFFEGVRFDQQVKTKKKQMTVQIVQAEDFFKILESTEEIMSDVDMTDHLKNELQDLL